MGKRRLIVAALAIIVLIAGAIFVFGTSSPNLRISAVQAAVHMIDGKPAVAITARIDNDGAPDRLLSVSSPDAEMAMLHGGEDASGLPIPAGTGASLSDDGAHIMLMGVSSDLAAGRLFPVVLQFQNSGAMAAKAALGGAGALMDMDHSSHGSHGSGMMMDGDLPTLSVSAAETETGWRIHLDTTNFRFAPEAMDGPHVAGEGHGHLYIGGIKIMRVTSPDVEIGALPPGEHVLRVTLNTNDHRAYADADGLVSAQASVTAR